MFWCDNFVFQWEKSLECIIFYAPRTVPPTFYWNDTYPPLSQLFLCHMCHLQCKTPNHSLPLKLYISHRVWLVCSYTGQFHHRSHSDNYGHNSWDTLLKWHPVSIIWKILLPCPPPPCTMFGEVGGGGRDSHKTCKRLLHVITVEITFSYFSLKCYQVSQGLMAIIVGLSDFALRNLSLLRSTWRYM